MSKQNRSEQTTLAMDVIAEVKAGKRRAEMLLCVSLMVNIALVLVVIFK